MQITHGETRLVIIDERVLVRESLAAMLSAAPNTRVVCVADCLDHAERFLNGTMPTVILIESDLEHEDAFSCVKRARELWPSIRVLLLASSKRKAITGRAVQVQVDGIVSHWDSFDSLRFALSAAINGQKYYSKSLYNGHSTSSSHPVSSPGNGQAKPFKQPRLSPREFDVLHHLVNGRTVKETAVAMSLASSTVDNHKARIMRKLDVHNAVQLTRYALREGFVPLR